MKDFSFENPNAPQSLAPQQAQPQISIQVNVNAKQLGETDYEVELKLEGSAKTESSTLFAFDLTFCGVFRIKNIPQDQVHPVIMIECPRLPLPLSRARSSQRPCAMAASRRSISIRSTFVALYRQRVAEAQKQNEQAAPQGDNPLAG